MANFLMDNLHAVRFAYGLIFFSLGFAIFLQPRRQSIYYLAPALSWLAGFAIIHAFADWGLVFIPAIEPINAEMVDGLLQIRSLGVIISFGFLMQFGIALLSHRYSGRRWLSLVPTVVTAVLVLLLLLDSYASDLPRSWMTDMKVMGRYFLGFPASVLAAWGLVTQAEALRRDRLRRYVGYLYGAAAGFLLYGIAAGLVVPARGFFPATMLNEERFFQLTGLPVEVLRASTIAAITFFIVRLLDIFHLESERRLRDVERDRALLREREVIARELHDGIMQTLYGTGLGLKQVMAMTAGQDGAAKAVLSELNREIGRSIVQMRSFVLDLKESVISGQELAEAVQSLVTDIGQIAGIATQVTVEGDLEQGRIPGGIREEVLAIVREGLSNVVRHAAAREVQVLLSCEDGTVLVRISDDGQGFGTDGGPGNGLTTVRDRVEALGGYMQVLSEVGRGTQLVAHLPVRASRVEREEQGA